MTRDCQWTRGWRTGSSHRCGVSIARLTVDDDKHDIALGSMDDLRPDISGWAPPQDSNVAERAGYQPPYRFRPAPRQYVSGVRCHHRREFLVVKIKTELPARDLRDLHLRQNM